eukprot:4266390-Pleurochrysis_carterae.AAC.1
MTMLCGGNDDDVLQSPAKIAALEVSGAVKTATSAAVLRSQRQRHCEDSNDGTVKTATTPAL